MTAITLAFEEFGEAHKPTLIILHGFFASARNWRQIAQKLSQDFHVYVPDCRNHGASPHNEMMDYAVMAEDILLFIEQHHLQQVSLLGHSMGGKTAMWFALNYPNKVDKLIIADIAPISYVHSFDNLVDNLKTLPVDEIASRKQADDYLAPLITELSYRQFLLQNLILIDGRYCWRIDLDIFQKTASNIVAFPNTEHLTPYNGKTLFLIGGDSNYVKESSYALFPSASLLAIANAGHWLHVQQPVAFLKQVREFLQTY
jgi:pimeloyl-ACP methyl ester carboxylesterase